MTELIHIPWRETTATVDGVTITIQSTGQPRAYADSVNICTLESERPAEEVLELVRTRFWPCNLPYEQWLREDNSMDAHFRSYYRFDEIKDGVWRYSVTSPFTD